MSEDLKNPGGFSDHSESNEETPPEGALAGLKAMATKDSSPALTPYSQAQLITCHMLNEQGGWGADHRVEVSQGEQYITQPKLNI